VSLNRWLTGLALTLALAGCAPVSAAEAPGNPAIARGAPEIEARPAADAGHLRTVGSRAVTLDPALVRDVGSAGYVLEIFAGLVKLNTRLELTPDLAETWDVSTDGLVYTFHLRPGISFAEGREITSADVVFSIERALSPRMASPVSIVYLGDIAGALEYHEGAAERVSGLSAPDARTVRIELRRPAAVFLSKMTHPVSFVVDREEVDDAEWFKDPNESGPFLLWRWREREEIILVRNDEYHTAALLEGVTIAIVGGGEGLLGYETGEMDIVPIGGRNVDRFRNSGERFSEDYVAVPQLSLYYVGFNTRVAPFDDVHVRRAFVLAVDMDKINRVTFRGHEQTANGILPTGLPGHDPERQALGYDPEEARRELALSRYGSAANLPDVTFLMAGSGLLPSQDTEAILYFLRENLGVTVRMQAIDFADFLLEVEDPEHQHQMIRFGWVADYPDPDNFLEFLFLSGSPENATRYLNPQVDALLEEARVEPDAERRYELYRQAEDLIIEDGVVLPMQFGVDHYLVQPYVRGFTPTTGMQEWMSTVWIDD
jgi:oligopeptide transport system substrate-binding protein